MLKSKNMNLVIKENVIFYNDNKELHNTQPIYESLMRKAVKLCKCYCTDMLILFDCLPRAIFDKSITEIDIYFRAYGIDWEYSNGRKVGGVPKHYRGVNKLVLDEKGYLYLYETNGNC
jgi:hypothetical protein